MAIVNPFKALRPQPQFATKVASRPYDVLNILEAGQRVFNQYNNPIDACRKSTFRAK